MPIDLIFVLGGLLFRLILLVPFTELRFFFCVDIPQFVLSRSSTGIDMAPAAVGSRRSSAVCLACIASVLLVAGCLALFSFPFVVKRVYNKEAYLVNDSAVFDLWVAPSSDTPLYMSFYLFNVTNADKIMSSGAKPIVKQAGPIVYKEVQKKYNLTFASDSSIVSYLNNHTYIYDEGRSAIKPTDKVITPNFILWTLLNSLPNDGTITDVLTQIFDQAYLDDKTKNAVSPFYVTSVEDMLWGAHDNELLVLLKNLSSLIPTENSMVNVLMKRSMPKTEDFPTKLGLQVNGSTDGLHSIYTGTDSMNEDRGVHTAWNGNSSLSYWGTPYCNMVNGTDGTIFPTFMEDVDRLYIFSPQLCRSAFMTVEETESMKGVETVKYHVPSEVFNATFEDNHGFCTKDGPCTDGLLDASKCYADAMLGSLPSIDNISLKLSVIISSPHFLYADNKTINSVDGMHPDQQTHETFINVHMDTGVVVKAAKRLQVNTILKTNAVTQKLEYMDNLPNKWSQLMPIFWAEEALLKDDEILDDVNDKFIFPQTVVSYSSYVAIGLGLLFLIIALSIFICCPIPQQKFLLKLFQLSILFFSQCLLTLTMTSKVTVMF
ncbi:lysosome membrane protein 2-like isoform X2 [Convolutriloba macropyga]|uniref:lysosome membrane protein 2-like isoform X2 n=1 Tax=Convolutriloba macropyga TaxID=536237 RepID=UPI003F520926